VDALARLLEGPRARGAFLLRVRMDPPWSVRVEDRAPLTVLAVTAGEAVLMSVDGGPAATRPARLRAGDVALLRGPEPYVVADEAATPVGVVIGPDQECRFPDGTATRGAFELGLRDWGNDPAGATTLLVGTYRMHGAAPARLLGALPERVVLTGLAAGSAVVALLEREIARDEPGQEVVLDRLLDLLAVEALRAWLFDGPGEEPGWHRALVDPVVGPAVRALQDEPDRAWTVAALASVSGFSRAALARRFSRLVGEPPMAFLAGWRLDLAADLLTDTDATVAAIARRVGYGGPFALSAAFKRRFGVSPREHREATRPA
jgi:AraC-like DNA-binding protein